MKKDVAERWVAFLQNKRKTRQRLATYTGVAKCCLGHLCEMYRQETGEGEWEPEGSYFDRIEGKSFAYFSLPYIGSIVKSEIYLPNKVRDWAGLTDEEQKQLSCLNDGHEGFPIERIKELGGIE